MLDLVSILILYQTKDCVSVFYGPHVVHWGDRQEEVKFCSSQEDCLQERLRNYVEWIAKKPEFGKELPAEGRSRSTSNQQFYLKNPEWVHERSFKYAQFCHESSHQVGIFLYPLLSLFLLCFWRSQKRQLVGGK